MRYFFMLIVLLSMTTVSLAQDINLLPDIKTTTNKVLSQEVTEEVKEKIQEEKKEDVFQDQAQMDIFLSKQQEKIEVLKLLSLDVEKAGLELKMQEINQKIRALDSGYSKNVVDNQSNALKENKYILKQIFMSGNIQQALVLVNGSFKQVSVDDMIFADDKVIAIDIDSITIGSSDGNKQKLILGHS